MHNRFLATTVIALALVFSQTGTFIVAALCPHLSSAAVACETPAAPTQSADHGMNHHMQMEPTGSLSTQPDGSTATAMAEATGSCKHCALHSRKRPNTASLRESNIPQRSSDQTISVSVTEVSVAQIFPAVVLPARAHGPPGTEISRHVLINIFRI